jgi:AcrR family transcriptional regulator
VASRRVEQLHIQGARTRERIVEIAREMLSESSETSMNTIAQAAGIGPGTLYRHFPSRENLVFAVYREEVHQLTGAADQLLAERQPLAALRAWLDRYAQYAMTKAGLVDALRAASTHSRFATEAYEPVVDAISRLLHANAAAGTVAADLTPDDVLLAVAGLYQLDPAGPWQKQAGRLLDIAVAGMRNSH